MTKEAIFEINSSEAFLEAALELFVYQYDNNAVYGEFCRRIGLRDPKRVQRLDQIPFLPISFFKTHKIRTGTFDPEMVFVSSGTTGTGDSQHFIRSLKLYEDAFNHSFAHFYGDPSEYTILALLPHYLERQNSSLLYMMDYLIRHSESPHSGFYLYNHQDLFYHLEMLKKGAGKVLLFGVTFALLEFVEHYALDYPDLIVMETGGMKGMRTELVKEEVHARLKKGFGVDKIHSEYGMCELTSQAYSLGDNLFQTPPWMKMIVRDQKEPLPSRETEVVGRVEPTTGVINIIDLANRDSCAFIATEDLGRRTSEGAIELLGRADYTQVRGCNLLVI